ELGDTSPQFKTKVLRCINEGIKDIATAHQWPFLREKGMAVLGESQDSYLLHLERPAPPTVELEVGGSLVSGKTYRALITFLEGVSGIESIAGEFSDTITAD